MSDKFEIGKQVICHLGPVSGIWPDMAKKYSYYGPKKDQILTVRDIVTFDNGMVGLHFYECVVMTHRGTDATFSPQFFRPVKDTNIDSLTMFLTDPLQGGNPNNKESI